MKDNSKNKFYWFYLAGFFLILMLPLLSIPPMFHPAPWGKSIVFRIIFSTLIFFFIWQFIFSSRDTTFLTAVRNVVSRKNGVFFPFWILVSLFGLFSLATIFSLDPHFSFWNSPYRGGGFLTLGLIMIFSVFLFFVVRKNDWQKLIDFSLGIGAITGIISIFQKFGWFSEYMKSYRWRPVATMGGSMFFALYLILLIFLSFSFAIVTKGKKKIYYFSVFAFLFIGIILAATRSTLLGLFIGSLFFVLAYPKKNRALFWLKISLTVVIVLGIVGVFGLKSQPKTISALKKNPIVGTLFDRLLPVIENPLSKTILRSRGSGWKVAFKAIENRPWLGYGPENFAIGFDKFYNPTLPGIKKSPGGGSTGWWDKGHSFVFDIGVSAGIPTLIVYLLFFTAIFWQLQKIKNLKLNQENENSEENEELQKTKIIAHGLQATFIGYLIADFFSFDVFSTYLMLFLAIAYSFYLISSNSYGNEENIVIGDKIRNTSSIINPGKYIFITILFFIFIWFIWSGNLKPLFINKKLNQYVFLSNKISSSRYTDPLAKKKEMLLLKKMDELVAEKSIIDNYVRLQYIDIISRATGVVPEKTPEISLKAIRILRQCQKLRPYYTRAWIYNIVYINKYIESYPRIDSKIKKNLNDEAYYDAKVAEKLSPDRPDIFIALAENYLINKEYKKAEEQADQCIKIDPDNGECWWAKTLSLIGLKDISKATKIMQIASQKGYKTKTVHALGQLISIYGNLAKKTGKKEYWQDLADLYKKLIEIDRERIEKIEKTRKIKVSENFQYHASLAYIYKVLKKYDEAKKEALIVEKLSPASKKAVEKFLKTLPPAK